MGFDATSERRRAARLPPPKGRFHDRGIAGRDRADWRAAFPDIAGGDGEFQGTRRNFGRSRKFIIRNIKSLLYFLIFTCLPMFINIRELPFIKVNVFC